MHMLLSSKWWSGASRQVESERSLSSTRAVWDTNTFRMSKCLGGLLVIVTACRKLAPSRCTMVALEGLAHGSWHAGEAREYTTLAHRPVVHMCAYIIYIDTAKQ